MRQIGVGGHFFGQQEAMAHFGLGDGDGRLHRVEVTWPASGRRVVQHGVERDQWLVVYE